MNLAASIDAHPDDSVALVSRGRRTTYGELRDQAARVRGGLTALGISPGDRVAIVCANNWYFVVAYLGALGAGAVAVPLNPTSPPAELERQLATVGARAAAVGASGQRVFAGVDRGAVPALEHVLEPGAGLEKLIEHEPAPAVDRQPDDLAALMFTSGTAGGPRAAMLSHGNLMANLEQVQRHPGRAQDASDVSLGVLPFFHIFGLNVVLGLSLFAGSSIVLIERFDPSSALEAIERHGATVVAGAPPMWAALADLPDGQAEAMATVRLAVTGASRLSEEVALRFQARYGVPISEGYGLTEASPVVTSSTGAAPRYGSIGLPVPGVEVRLVDAEGDDVPAGDAGEIWVRGPSVFGGYWNDADATRAALTSDGWLRTGDVAVVDDDGYLYLVDRAKDLIIVSGFNVFPAEVEEVLADHPAVEQAAVIGVPHPHSGEAVKAFVVLREGRTCDEDDLIEHCAQRLARYKCPSKVMFVDELPTGAGGKLLRRALG